VIESHDDHDGSAQGIDGLDTRAWSDDDGHWGDPLLREEAVEVKMNLPGCGVMHLRSWFDGEDDA
jgi:hypothetical protein